MVIYLGPTEKEHGLAYVAFSRATRFSNIGIIGGLTEERLTKKISQQKKLQVRLIEDARLAKLAETTMEKYQQILAANPQLAQIGA